MSILNDTTAEQFSAALGSVRGLGVRDSLLRGLEIAPSSQLLLLVGGEDRKVADRAALTLADRLCTDTDEPVAAPLAVTPTICRLLWPQLAADRLSAHARSRLREGLSTHLYIEGTATDVLLAVAHLLACADSEPSLDQLAHVTGRRIIHLHGKNELQAGESMGPLFEELLALYRQDAEHRLRYVPALLVAISYYDRGRRLQLADVLAADPELRRHRRLLAAWTAEFHGDYVDQQVIDALIAGRASIRGDRELEALIRAWASKLGSNVNITEAAWALARERWTASGDGYEPIRQAIRDELAQREYLGPNADFAFVGDGPLGPLAQEVIAAALNKPDGRSRLTLLRCLHRVDATTRATSQFAALADAFADSIRDGIRNELDKVRHGIAVHADSDGLDGFRKRHGRAEAQLVSAIEQLAADAAASYRQAILDGQPVEKLDSAYKRKASALVADLLADKDCAWQWITHYSSSADRLREALGMSRRQLHKLLGDRDVLGTVCEQVVFNEFNVHTGWPERGLSDLGNQHNFDRALREEFGEANAA